MSKPSNSLFSLLRLLLMLIPVAVATGCANIGNPSGGPRDEDPPIFMFADPAPGSVNVTKGKMTLTFNELVNVKDAFSKVVVSPLSSSIPKVSSQGRRVTIQFDSLAPDATYTVDFADAIEDNNEGNKIQGFTYTFSTGETLDSLRISGMVLAARNLEPQQSMIVGVTQNLADSAFTRLPLLRVAKTDDRGRFTIRGLKEGSYRVYALGDRDNDYKYANPEEDIAFYDFEVTPTSQPATAIDTMFNKLTGEIDSIVTRGRTIFLPNDILLRSFNSEKRTQYLGKSERPDSTKLFIKLNTRAASMPQLDAIGFPGLMREAVKEGRKENDSIIYWLPEKLVHVDSLFVETRYLRTDSTGVLAEQIDTLRFFSPARPVEKKQKSKKADTVNQDSIRALTMDIKALSPSSHDVYLPLSIQFETPLAYLNQKAFHLEMKVDSLWKPIADAPPLVMKDSLSPRDFEMKYDWKFGTAYRLTADSLAATGIYGKPTRPFTHEFTVKKKDDYCSLLLNLSGLEPGVPAFVELLNGSDQPVRAEKVGTGNSVRFQYLEPGKYFVRVIEDYNGNGEFDTGDYDRLLQPDLAYYYPKAINIKKNWDKEESWNVFDTPIEQQKPAAIKKNRPATDKRSKKNNEETEEEEEDEIFDPTANPFDPNQKKRRRNNAGFGY